MVPEPSIAEDVLQQRPLVTDSLCIGFFPWFMVALITCYLLRVQIMFSEQLSVRLFLLADHYNLFREGWGSGDRLGRRRPGMGGMSGRLRVRAGGRLGQPGWLGRLGRLGRWVVWGRLQ